MPWYPSGQTTITGPDGRQQTNYFLLFPTNCTSRGISYGCMGLKYKTQMPEGTVVEDYWEVNEPWIGTGANVDRKNAYIRARFKTLPGSLNRTSATRFDCDKNGNLTSKQEFDWVASVPRTGGVVSGVPSGTVLRTTTNTYYKQSVPATDPMPSSFNQTDANAYWNNYAVKVKGEVKRSHLTDGVNPAGVTDFTYDDGGAGTTANVTQEARWDNTKSPSLPATLDQTSAVVWVRSWNQGNLIQETDPDGQVTVYDYSGTSDWLLPDGTHCSATYGDLYPTKITQAGGMRETWLCYDWPTGLVRASKDAKNNISTTFDYDPYGRRNKTVEAGLRTTDTTYDDDDTDRQVTVTADRDNAGNVSRMTTIYDFDPLGQLWQKRSNDDTGGAVTTSTTGVREQWGERLDANGHYAVYSAHSAPSRTGVDTTIGWKRRKYDREGRLVEEAYFSGADKPAPWGTNTSSMGATSLGYSDEATTVTDPSGRVKTQKTDALGRLASVDEGGVSNATYTYSICLPGGIAA